MNGRSKAKAIAKSESHDSYYQPSWSAALLALIAALLLIGHGLARADDLSQKPANAYSQPAPARIAVALGCTDDMDFSPEDNQPSPFDADDVAFHSGRARPFAMLKAALPQALDSCQDPSERLDNT